MNPRRPSSPLIHNFPQLPPKEPAPKLPEFGRGLRLRLAFIFVGFAAFFVLVGFRLVQLQVLVNPELEALAKRQFEKVGQTSPHRLSIYDRNREELAVSMPASSIFARPRLIPNKRRVAARLAEVLGGSAEKWLRKLDASKPFVWIQRQVSEDKVKEIASKNLPGIFLETENKRSYPNGELAANVLGFTDIDGNGISGLELTLNEELLKKGSRFAIPRDGKGNPSYLSKKYFREDDGETGVYVTLDRRLQHAVEEELDRAMEETGARSVLAAVMDPFTGEIFAMAQRPSFDPNDYSSADANYFTNRFISHLYEPGSTMKTLFASEAIQQGIMHSKTPIDCEKGKLQIGPKRIREAESNHVFGVLPLEKVIMVSSNVGAVKVAQALGTDRVRSTLDKFGLTRRTGVSLPGEVTAAPRGDKFWRPIFLATVGFGQGVSVTPLQMLSAYAPFANGGYLVRPRILLRENVSEERLEVRRVLSPGTAQVMKQMLVGVTQHKDGTGALAAIPSIAVAGKTGTAQKYEAGVGYNSKKYLSSFIGYLPADQPELVIGVFVDEPKAPYYASKVAAPLFRRISERSLQILDRMPKTSIRPSQAASHRAIFTEDAHAPVALAPVAAERWLMPDLKGMNMREALRAVGSHLSNVKVSGNGYLQSQSPAKGTVVSPETPVALTFTPEG